MTEGQHEYEDVEGIGQVRVFDSYDDGPSTMLWCEFCVAWHRHGVGGGYTGAHCTFSESPYRLVGYITRSVGQWSKAVEAQHVEEQRRARKAYKEWSHLGGHEGRVSWRDVYEGRVGTGRKTSTGAYVSAAL